VAEGRRGKDDRKNALAPFACTIASLSDITGCVKCICLDVMKMFSKINLFLFHTAKACQCFRVIRYFVLYCCLPMVGFAKER
jgi:hypothetical protein